MNRNAAKPEVIEVRIGASGAQIRAVVAGRLTYVDDNGEERALNLMLCHQNYLATHVTGKKVRRKDRSTGKIVEEPARLQPGNKPVGFRRVVSTPPSVRLLSDPNVRFVFASRDEAYALLLDPLRDDGWRTLDLD